MTEEEEWKNRYVGLLHAGKYIEADKLKNKHIPKKLYKFEPFTDTRISTLKKSIYLSHLTGFDVPK